MLTFVNLALYQFCPSTKLQLKSKCRFGLSETVSASLASGYWLDYQLLNEAVNFGQEQLEVPGRHHY
jgi:hypothetical protein